MLILMDRLLGNVSDNDVRSSRYQEASSLSSASNLESHELKLTSTLVPFRTSAACQHGKMRRWGHARIRGRPPPSTTQRNTAAAKTKDSCFQNPSSPFSPIKPFFSLFLSKNLLAIANSLTTITRLWSLNFPLTTSEHRVTNTPTLTFTFHHR